MATKLVSTSTSSCTGCAFIDDHNGCRAHQPCPETGIWIPEGHELEITDRGDFVFNPSTGEVISTTIDDFKPIHVGKDTTWFLDGFDKPVEGDNPPTYRLKRITSNLTDLSEREFLTKRRADKECFKLNELAIAHGFPVTFEVVTNDQ
jgi:hypothetical protein